MTLTRDFEILEYGSFSNLERLEYVKDFLDNNDNRILCIDTEYTLLSNLRVLQYIHYIPKTVNLISTNLKEILDDEKYKEATLKDFEFLTIDLLIIECNSTTVQKQNVIHELYIQFSYIINKNNSKKIILIKQANILNNLVEMFKINFQNLNVSISDTFDVNDFITYRKLYEKEITFQGKTTSLKKLMIDDLEIKTLETLFDKNVIIEIFNNEKLEIDSKPLTISDLEGACAELFIKIKTEILVDSLLQKTSDDIYIISGVYWRFDCDPRNVHQRLFKALNLEQNQDVQICNQTNILTIRDKYKIQDNQISNCKRIHLVDDQFESEHFKQLCDDNLNKKIYWIKWDEPKFLLQKVYDHEFYITRKFYKILKVVIKNKANKVVENKKIVLTQETEDYFVFTGIRDDDYLTLAKILDLEINLLDRTRVFIKQTEKAAQEIFDNIDDTVHWLQIENDQQIVWKNSKGSLKYLRKYIDKEQSTKEEENSLFENIKDKQTIIIAGDPGMGKSTTLVKLYASTEILATHWVININLKNCINVIKEVDGDNVNVLEFLLKVDPNLNNNLAKILLELVLTESKYFKKTLLITFDGFDEVIYKSDKGKVIALLKYLKYHSKVKFWITTRLEDQEILEDNLCTFAIKFDPLNEDDQKSFIKKYLKSRLSLVLSKDRFNFFQNDTMITIKMKNFSDAVREKIKSVFGSDAFIAVPLQLFLLLEGLKTEHNLEGLEVIKCGVELFKDLVNDFKKPDFSYLGNNILEIYENFINGKYETYFKKVRISQDEIKSVIKKQFNDYCKDLAKSSIFLLKSNESLEDFKKIFLSPGLIKSRNNNLTFLHPTFGDYFAFKVCTNWINKSELPTQKKQEYLFLKILNDDNFKVVRIFLNIWLGDKLKNASKPILPETLKQYGEIIKGGLQFSKGSFDERYKPFYIAAKEGNATIIDFIVCCLESSCPNVISKVLLIHYLKNFFEERDDDGNNTLHIASRHDTVMTALLGFLQTDQEYFKEFVKKTNGFGKSIFHCLGELGNTKMVKIIIDTIHMKYRVDVFTSPIINGLLGCDSLLLDLCLNGHIQVVKTLLESIEEYDRVSIIMQNSLIDWSIKNSPIEFTIYLLNELLRNYSKENIKLLDFLFNENNEGDTVLMTAAKFNQIEIVKKLLACTEDDTIRTTMLLNGSNELNPLHVATNYNNYEIVEELLITAKNISEETTKKLLFSADKNGRNALHLAAKCGSCEIVTKLLTAAKDISVEMAEELILSFDKNENNVLVHAIDDKDFTSTSVNGIINLLLKEARKLTLEKKIPLGNDSNIMSKLIFHENNEKINVIVYIMCNHPIDTCLRKKIMNAFKLVNKYSNIWDQIQKELEDPLIPVSKRKKFCDSINTSSECNSNLRPTCSTDAIQESTSNCPSIKIELEE